MPIGGIKHKHAPVPPAGLTPVALDVRNEEREVSLRELRVQLASERRRVCPGIAVVAGGLVLRRARGATQKKREKKTVKRGAVGPQRHQQRLAIDQNVGRRFSACVSVFRDFSNTLLRLLEEGGGARVFWSASMRDNAFMNSRDKFATNKPIIEQAHGRSDVLVKRTLEASVQTFRF